MDPTDTGSHHKGRVLQPVLELFHALIQILHPQDCRLLSKDRLKT